MKTLNVIKMAIIAVIASANLVACTDEYDDSELWDKVNSIDDRVTKIENSLKIYNENLTSLTAIVKALQEKRYVEGISYLTNGYTITFSDGEVITIKNGENGKDAPVINVQYENGKYYWVQTIDGVTEWLLDNNGNKIPASGNDGKTPLLKVDSQGYWTVSYDNGNSYSRISDNNGKPVQAIGHDGDSFFRSVTTTSDEVIIELADGTEIVIPLGEQLPYKAVDLGLSVRWASFNIGAITPSESGELYLWGDSKNTGVIGNYNAPSTDKISGTTYDIARSLWGSNWRMPTKAEQTELVTKCTWTRSIVNGVKGMKVTGNNGNSIFLPPTGYMIGTQLNDADYGYYWVGEAYTTDYGQLGYVFYYNNQSYYYNGSWNTSWVKMAVRPVKE